MAGVIILIRAAVCWRVSTRHWRMDIHPRRLIDPPASEDSVRLSSAVIIRAADFAYFLYILQKIYERSEIRTKSHVIHSQRRIPLGHVDDTDCLHLACIMFDFGRSGGSKWRTPPEASEDRQFQLTRQFIHTPREAFVNLSKIILIRQGSNPAPCDF